MGINWENYISPSLKIFISSQCGILSFTAELGNLKICKSQVFF